MNEITIFANKYYYYKCPYSYFWSGQENIGNTLSILDIIEKNDTKYRKTLLKHLVDCRKTISKTMNLNGYVNEIDRLIFHMSLISEQSIQKSPSLTLAMKLFFIEKLNEDNKIKKLKYI